MTEVDFRKAELHVVRCDGHDVAALEKTFRALDDVENLPKVIIADTVKGKGVSFMENNNEFHGKAPTPEQLKIALGELE